MLTVKGWSFCLSLRNSAAYIKEVELQIIEICSSNWPNLLSLPPPFPSSYWWSHCTSPVNCKLASKSCTVTRQTVKFPYIHMMTPDDNGPRWENISRMRAG